MHARVACTPASSRDCFPLYARPKCGLRSRQQFDNDAALHARRCLTTTETVVYATMGAAVCVVPSPMHVSAQDICERSVRWFRICSAYSGGGVISTSRERQTGDCPVADG